MHATRRSLRHAGGTDRAGLHRRGDPVVLERGDCPPDVQRPAFVSARRSASGAAAAGRLSAPSRWLPAPSGWLPAHPRARRLSAAAGAAAGRLPPGGYPPGGQQYPPYPPGQPGYGAPYGAPGGFGAPAGRPTKKWYQRWWVWVVGVLAILIIAIVVFAALSGNKYALESKIKDTLKKATACTVSNVNVPELDQHRRRAQLHLHRHGRRHPAQPARPVRHRPPLHGPRAVTRAWGGAADPAAPPHAKMPFVTIPAGLDPAASPSTSNFPPTGPAGSTSLPGARARWRRPGVDGLFTFEGPHDVFFPLVAACADGPPGLDLMTNVAMAFPRSPMHLANAAYDLQLMSQRTLPARSRHPDQAPHRASLRRAPGRVRSPGCARSCSRSRRSSTAGKAWRRWTSAASSPPTR